MKRLYLVRHAKATQESGRDDFKRSLVKSGRSDAEKAARQFKKITDVPALIISSSAKRALQTAEIFAKEFKRKPKKIQAHKEIYDTGSSAIIALLKGLDAAVNSAMVVGHVPALNEVAESLLKNFKDEIPTSGVVAIDLNVETWADLKGGVGTLVFFQYPALKKEKAQQSESIRKSLQKNIKTAVEKELQKVDPQSAQEMTGALKKAITRITKKFGKLLKAAEKAKANPKKEKAQVAETPKSTSKTKTSKKKNEKESKK